MSNRFLLEMNIISPRHLLQGYLEVRRVVLPSPPHPLVVLHLAEVRLSHGGSGPGSLEDTVLIRALVHWQRSGSGLATKKQDFSSWPCLPPSLGHRFGAGPGPARAGGRAPAARVRVRGVRVPRAGGCRPLCGQRLPFHSKIPQLCFGFTILLISVIHTAGTWIGLRYRSSDFRTLYETRPAPKRKQRVP